MFEESKKVNLSRKQRIIMVLGLSPPPSLIFYREKFHGRQGVKWIERKTEKKMPCQCLASSFSPEKVATCAASEQFPCRGLAVQSPAGALWGV
jgi:hypothetical protein